MVKSNNRKFSIVSLALFVVVLLFASCGKGDGKSSGKDSTPEYIYESKFNDLGTVGVDYVSQSCIKDGNIYMTGSHYEYNEKKQSGKSINYLMKGSVDSKNIDMAEIKGLKENETPSTLFMDEEGNIYMLSSVYNYNEKTGASNTKYYMAELAEDGSLSGHVELKPGLKKNEELYLGGTAVYEDEKLITFSDQKIYIFNKDGSLAKTAESDNYIDSIFTANNGKIYIMNYNGICGLDTDTGNFGETIDLGDRIIYNIKNVKQGKDGIVYLNNDDGLYECDLSKNKLELLFNWINVDINSNNILDFQMMEDGSLIVLSTLSNYNDSGKGGSTSSVEIASVNKKKYSEARQKKRLTLAASYISQPLKEEILKYNKGSEDYHIEIKSYNTYEDPQKQMNLDIISGDIPDIIELSGLSKSMYIKKGMLADLYPFIEKDGEIKKEDFVDSVINTIEHNGKLYYMPTSFAVNVLIGSKKVFGDMESWTYEEMEEKYKSMPKNGVFMQDMTREWFMYNMLGSQMKDFIDFETGEVNLDSEEFINMLEFSKNFQTSDQYMKEREANGWQNESKVELINSGRLLLSEMFLYDFSDIQINEKLYKKQGGYTVISQPSKDKNNKLAMGSGDACLAISEKCNDKDGAWKFLRGIFTYEYQKKISDNYGFPVRKDVLEKKIEYAMATKAYKDDDGTQVTPITDSTYSMDDFTVELKPYTKAHMDLFRSIVDRIGKENNYDTYFNDISEIINEESKAFFAGDKTAEETAKILQSRVKIYVSENS
ncbi:MAG: extracellular solute-binding protein [Lachnospiraceae bacterium]|nr:extracellular solute-binding protein [Lachnospiraceae bacterium]